MIGGQAVFIGSLKAIWGFLVLHGFGGRGLLLMVVITGLPQWDSSAPIK